MSLHIYIYYYAYIFNLQIIFHLSLDLKTMDDKLKKYCYNTKELFILDMERIFNNCKQYNKNTTKYYKCAHELELFFRDQLKEKGLVD